MPSPQPGVFTVDARAHEHLELDLVGPFQPGLIADALAELGSRVVIGIAPSRWDDAEGVGDFTTIVGADGFTMPATQHHLWIWVKGERPDDVFDTAQRVAALLRPMAAVASDETGFEYHDSRDITGFIDGTENPTLAEAPAVALNDAGASIVLYQKWVHDLDAFGTLSVADQERVIGRTKPDSVELDDKPETAHISRVVIEEDGEELEIYRRSTPFGNAREHGLLFVAFAAERRRLDRMLRRMAGVEDGIRDALTRYSRPVSAGYYVVPSMEALRR
ncbi:MAG: Dyp-type peroxidase [Acidimicrobiales bacterium]